MLLSGSIPIPAVLLVAEDPTRIPSPALPAPLEIADWTLVAAGLVVCATVFVRWLRRRRHRVPDEPMPPVGPGIREDAVLPPVLAYLLAVAILTVVTGRLFPEPGDIRATLLVNNGAQLTGIAACLWVMNSRTAGGLRSLFRGAGQRSVASNALAAVAAILAALAVSPLVYQATVWTILCWDPDFAPTTHSTLSALKDPSRSAGLVTALWLGAAVIAPVAEEVFFRGILQNALANLMRSPAAGIVLAAAAFGLVHTSQPDAVPALITLGVLLGWVYQRRGSLAIPIVVHAVFNLKTLVWDALARAPDWAS